MEGGGSEGRHAYCPIIVPVVIKPFSVYQIYDHLTHVLTNTILLNDMGW